MGSPASKCMRLHQPRSQLVQELRPLPVVQPGQVLLRVRACGVCRTDLHVVDGDLPFLGAPLVPGHEIVGEVIAQGAGISIPLGTRLGVPWLGYTCGQCKFCLLGEENLCDRARFTGYHLDGGYAEHVVADARYCFELPPSIDDTHAAPLLCAGLIGYRSYRKTGNARRLGVYGFGNAAHLIAQIALYEGRELFVFTRPGDTKTQQSAKALGAKWAGGSDEMPPKKLDAAIIFASVGPLVPAAMRALAKGGVVVCGGIHMTDIPSFPYTDLWEERVITSVANLTRRDGDEFLELAPRVPVKTHTETFPLEQANTALNRFRAGELEGTAVLIVNTDAN
jgi:alcohol dehydrogenase, propanol-preferring